MRRVLGEPRTELVALGNRLEAVALAETVGFPVILTTMTLTHFAGEASATT